MYSVVAVLLVVTLVFVVVFASPVSAEEHKYQAAEPPKPEQPVDWAALFAMHYYKRVDDFKKENASLPKDRKNIVFIGDSITEGFALQEFLPGLPALNRGIGADGIGVDSDRGVINRMNESVFDCSPEAVFLLIGINDLHQDPRTPEHCMEVYRKIVEQILEKFPKVKLVLETLLPVGPGVLNPQIVNPRVLQFNKLIADLAKEKSLKVLDLNALYRDAEGLLPKEVSDDGLHLKKENYDRWAEKVKEILKAP